MPSPVVFIPCYNAQSTILETIESVRHAVMNAAISIPIWICDDCSTDGTWWKLKSYSDQNVGIVIFKNDQNLGERQTTNLFAHRCAQKFDWMFILHADDIARPDWLVESLEWIRQFDYSEVFTVWSSFDTRVVETGELKTGDDSGNVLVLKRDKAEIRDLLEHIYSYWHISGAALNLKLFGHLGGFDERMAQFGDNDFFIRGLLKGYVDVYISRALTEYRITNHSVSSVSYDTNRDIVEVDLLISKYSGILGKSGTRKLLDYCIRYSLIRGVKALTQRNWAKTKMNFKSFIKALTSYPI
jgi:glycosyltransferase involved in cell wall biosynthesis